MWSRGGEYIPTAVFKMKRIFLIIWELCRDFCDFYLFRVFSSQERIAYFTQNSLAHENILISDSRVSWTIKWSYQWLLCKLYYSRICNGTVGWSMTVEKEIAAFHRIRQMWFCHTIPLKERELHILQPAYLNERFLLEMHLSLV